MGLRRGPWDGPSGITVVETTLGDTARSDMENEDDDVDDDVDSLSFEADFKLEEESFSSLLSFFLVPFLGSEVECSESEESSFLMLSIPAEDEDDAEDDEAVDNVAEDDDD